MDVEYRYDWKLIACVDDHWGIGRQGQLLIDIRLIKKHLRRIRSERLLLEAEKQWRDFRVHGRCLIAPI